MNKFTQMVDDAIESKKINSYMGDKLHKSCEFGMTDEVFEHAYNDACVCSKLGVDNDKNHSIVFFVLNTIDDVLDDTFGKKLSTDDVYSLCKYIINNKDEKYPLDDLVDLRIIIYNWMGDKHKKTAYPNSVGYSNRMPIYDRAKWIDATKVIYSLLKDEGNTYQKALDVATAGWDSEERFKFSNWLKYYESGNTEKYKVKNAHLKKEALGIDDINLPSGMLNPATRSNNLGVMQAPTAAEQRITQKEKDIQNARLLKQKMKSRLTSLKRLLDKYNDILPHQSLERVQDEMNALDKSLSKLNVYASIQDRIVRAGHIIKRAGFDEGADLLYKIADEAPEGIDPKSTKSDADVIRAIPQPADPHPEIPDNSGALIDIQTIILRLEGVSKQLKSRNTIRELASIDILLNELGMASLFPDLTDAQSKLIESFGYASKKIEDIVAKLRGVGTARTLDSDTISAPSAGPLQNPQPPQKKPQNIDKRDVQQKPVGAVEQKLPGE